MEKIINIEDLIIHGFGGDFNAKYGYGYEEETELFDFIDYYYRDNVEKIYIDCIKGMETLKDAAEECSHEWVGCYVSDTELDQYMSKESYDQIHAFEDIVAFNSGLIDGDYYATVREVFRQEWLEELEEQLKRFKTDFIDWVNNTVTGELPEVEEE